MRAKGEGAGAGDSQPFPTSLPNPPCLWVASKKPLLGHGTHSRQRSEGPLLKEPGGGMLVGQQGAQMPKKIHFNTSFPTCPKYSALQSPLHSW